MDENAIQVVNVGKVFKLPHEKTSTLKSAVINFRRHKRGYEMQKALDSVSFEVKKGEFFGIVGRNGSGKSTLLKLLAGIYTPTKGVIHIKGSLTPFIELGVGFNPELTARENVYLNGALLGFNRKEMRSMYKDIVAFAELEKFMDQKLKNFSSGMQVRLAFSIAIRADTDILVLDEVLAVGDSNFQRKCFDYFGKIKNTNKTVVLVTHDMTAVERFCSRALLLHNGRVLQVGEPGRVTKKYSDLNLQASSENINADGIGGKKQALIVAKAEVMIDGKATKIVRATDKEIVISCELHSKKDVNSVSFGMIIYNGSGSPLFATNTRALKEDLSLQKNKIRRVQVTLDNIFSNGEYSIAISVKDRDQTQIFYTQSGIANFIVGGRKHEFALASPNYKLTID